MKLSKIAALGLVLALSAGCDKDKKPEAEGASNSATNGTNGAAKPSTAGQETAPESGKSAQLPFEATGPVAMVDGVAITAEDYNDCFEVGNIGPDSQIERLGRMSSLSVGNVLVGEDGTCAVVASMGFVAFSFNPALAAA